MISQETCEKIWHCYREIKVAENLIAEVTKLISEHGVDKNAPVLTDAFGRMQHLELGVPSGDNSRTLFRLSNDLAIPVMKAHVAAKRAELASFMAAAEVELKGGAV